MSGTKTESKVERRQWPDSGWTDRKLTSGMTNDMAWRMGIIASLAGDTNRKDVGDPIDRGLILLRLLHESGFDVLPFTGKERP